MSIDVSGLWSANTLQRPVHSHIAAQQNAVQATLVDPRRLPTKGPQALAAHQQQQSVLDMILHGRTMEDYKTWAQKNPMQAAREAFKQRAIAAKAAPVAPITHGDTLSARVMGTNSVTATPVKITQPGVDTAITTAVPQTPSDGIPRMTPMSGWTTAGSNFRTPALPSI